MAAPRPQYPNIIPSSPMSPNNVQTSPSSPSRIPPPTQLPPSISEINDITTTTTATIAPSSQPPQPHQWSSTMKRPTIQSSIESCKKLLNNERQMKILLLSSDTGGGHKASAQALHKALEKVHQTAPTNLQIKIIDFWVDGARGPFSNFPQQYTFLAKHPWMWKFTYEITRFPPGRAITESFFSTFGHVNIRQVFLDYNPDIIISVHPLVNTLSMKVLNDLYKKKLVLKKPCYVTVVTDLGGAHPTWFHPSVNRTYIPIESVKKTAKKCGLLESQLKVYGLPVRPDFWSDNESSDANITDKQQIRKKLRIVEDVPTILAVGGGDGVGGLKAIAAALATDLPKKLSNLHQDQGENKVIVQIVVICGKNEKLKKWLIEKEWDSKVSVVALGYVTNMSEWMSASDIICTKAGPGTIAESLIRGLPMILTAFLPGQEEANVKFVTGKNVGKFVKKVNKIVDTIWKWLKEPNLLNEMSKRCIELGRPDASLQIAKDITQFASEYIEKNVKELEEDLKKEERKLRLHRNQKASIRRGMLAPYMPMREFLPDGDMDNSYNQIDDGWTSHLKIRVKIFMKIVFGGLLARDIATRGRSRATPPSSPLETITEHGEQVNEEDNRENN